MKARIDPEQLAETVRLLHTCADRVTQAGINVTRAGVDDVASVTVERRAALVATMLYAEATELRHVVDEARRVLGGDRDLVLLAERVFGPSAVAPSQFADTAAMDQWREHVARLADVPMRQVQRTERATGADDSKPWRAVGARRALPGRRRLATAPTFTMPRSAPKTRSGPAIE